MSKRSKKKGGRGGDNANAAVAMDDPKWRKLAAEEFEIFQASRTDRIPLLYTESMDILEWIERFTLKATTAKWEEGVLLEKARACFTDEHLPYALHRNCDDFEEFADVLKKVMGGVLDKDEARTKWQGCRWKENKDPIRTHYKQWITLRHKFQDLGGDTSNEVIVFLRSLGSDNAAHFSSIVPKIITSMDGEGSNARVSPRTVLDIVEAIEAEDRELDYFADGEERIAPEPTFVARRYEPPANTAPSRPRDQRSNQEWQRRSTKNTRARPYDQNYYRCTRCEGDHNSARCPIAREEEARVERMESARRFARAAEERAARMDASRRLRLQQRELEVRQERQRHEVQDRQNRTNPTRADQARERRGGDTSHRVQRTVPGGRPAKSRRDSRSDDTGRDSRHVKTARKSMSRGEHRSDMRRQRESHNAGYKQSGKA
jgi:hypothetical protein